MAPDTQRVVGSAASDAASTTGQKPKAKGRALKVLAPKTIAKNRLDIYERNATDSPLLRLPPEIRNRIWHMLLGGKTLHITTNNGRPRHAICQGDTDDDDAADRIKGLENGCDRETHGSRHRNCTLFAWDFLARCPDCLRLDVLRVCRQTHAEAAFLPYQSNVFSFCAEDSLTTLLKTLVPAQARAIRSIVLCGHIHRRQNRTKLISNKLGGLRKLTYFVEFQSWSSGSRFRYAHYNVTVAEETHTALQYERLPLTCATVAAYNVTTRSNIAAADLVPKALLLEWAADMEKRLVSAWDQAAFERSVAEKKARSEEERAPKEDIMRERKKSSRTGHGLRPAKAC
ncbi:hypothetical protein LTR85_000072 [Meristemomyces frigidus]|nr:hypothetical protein LTR85_000072 [Meristemomyces frigidus]